MAEKLQLTTAAKALRINLDPNRYGAFAEIGAGQEVARHFFLAGKASQTIAKSMSAYDMTYSDEIYGREKNGRYVCEPRLIKMLQKETTLLVRRLGATRGENTKFFAFANTVATGSPESPKCHGWMGVRFQIDPLGDFNEIVLHVRMLDRTRLQQQDALGVLGVSLLDAAFYEYKNPEKFLASLMENVKKGQVMIDLIRFSGKDLSAFDSRQFSLELVRRGYSEGALFAPSGEVVSISDALWGKPILIQRGDFRPLTNSHVDVLSKGTEQVKRDLRELPLTLLEVSIPENSKSKHLLDFIGRIELANACGYHMLVTGFSLYDELKRFLRKHTSRPMFLVLSASKLAKLFDESKYHHLEGGLPEGIGRILDEQTKLFVYPHKSNETCLTAQLYRPVSPTDLIYDFFWKKKLIQDISACDTSNEYIHSASVRRRIQKKERGWEKDVPAPVAEWIKKHKPW